jgi:hypothetical protein
VPANTFVLLKDLRDTHVLRTERDKEVDALRKQLSEPREPIAQLQACSTSLQSWKNGLAQWKQATENCQAALANSSSNCTILGEIRRLELQKSALERDSRILSSEGVNGNPSNGISKNNQVKLENTQRAIHDLEVRALEVAKRLTCGQ